MFDLLARVTELDSANVTRDVILACVCSSRASLLEGIVRLQVVRSSLLQPTMAGISYYFSLSCVCMVVLRYKSAR